MLPVKRILCPTDFSEHSYAALRTANELARHFGAELVVVHVVTPVPVVDVPSLHGGFDVERYQASLEESARRSLEAVLAAETGEGVAAQGRVVVGHPPTEIVNASRDDKVDLIVLSTHGRSGVSHLLFGSVAERVVRSAACPVLTIRAR